MLNVGVMLNHVESESLTRTLEAIRSILHLCLAHDVYMSAILAMFFLFLYVLSDQKTPLATNSMQILQPWSILNYPQTSLSRALPIRWLATRTSESSYFQSARFGWRCILQFRRCSTFRRALTRKGFSHLGVHPRKPNMEPEVVPPYKKNIYKEPFFGGSTLVFKGCIPNHHKIPKQGCGATANFKNHI